MIEGEGGERMVDRKMMSESLPCDIPPGEMTSDAAR
jgi:hypothetical protein